MAAMTAQTEPTILYARTMAVKELRYVFSLMSHTVSKEEELTQTTKMMPNHGM